MRWFLQQHARLMVTLAALMLGINVLLGTALYHNNQYELEALNKRLQHFERIDSDVLSMLIAPYGLTMAAPSSTYVKMKPYPIVVGDKTIMAFSKPIWLSRSHWFIIVNLFLVLSLWSALARRSKPQQKLVSNNAQAQPNQQIKGADVLSMGHLYHQLLIQVYSDRLKPVSPSIMALVEVMLQETYGQQHKVRCKLVSEGRVTISMMQISEEQLVKYSNEFHAHFVRCLKALLCDLQASDIKIGMCSFQLGADQGIVYQLAQAALLKAKESSNKNWIRTPFSQQQSLRVAAQSCPLKEVIDKQQFTCFFQPVFNLHNYGIHHFETFIRIAHPELGLLPAYSLTHSEEDELRVDTALLKRVSSVLEKETHPEWISLQLSDASWRNADMWIEVEKLLRSSHKVTLECNAEFMHKYPRLVLKHLRSDAMKGKKLIVVNVTQWPMRTFERFAPFIEAIKLGNSETSDIETDRSAQRKVLHFVANAQRLGVPIFATAIEQRAQVNALKQLGVEAAQGAYFSGSLNELNESHFMR